MIDPIRRLAPILRLAPAKLNLTLAVARVRQDGYHELHSVVVRLALCDRLSLALSSGRDDTLHVSGFEAGPSSDNLVLRALDATRRAVGAGWAGAAAGAIGDARLAPVLAARLDKRIPVAAGLGGGSSDAAVAMDGALEAWGAELNGDDRLNVALRLGSDVPFFLAGGAALVEGRGERVMPLPDLRGDQPGVLLVTPDIRLSTAEVFAAHAAGLGRGNAGATRATSEHLAGELRTGLKASDLLLRAGVLASANDLLGAAAVVLPEILTIRRRMARLLGRPVGLSGSGPTCWVLYPSLAETEEAASLVRDAFHDGRIPNPGGGRPFVGATTFAVNSRPGDAPDGGSR